MPLCEYRRTSVFPVFLCFSAFLCAFCVLFCVNICASLCASAFLPSSRRLADSSLCYRLDSTLFSRDLCHWATALAPGGFACQFLNALTLFNWCQNRSSTENKTRIQPYEYARGGKEEELNRIDRLATKKDWPSTKKNRRPSSQTKPSSTATLHQHDARPLSLCNPPLSPRPALLDSPEQ